MPTDPRLTRRQTLATAGVSGAGLILGQALALPGLAAAPSLAAAVALTPEQEEGPYYVDLEKVRIDVIGNRKGIPLHLAIAVLSTRTGSPIHGAAVDIWHCDASGRYSDEAQNDTVGQTWLRGVQLTNSRGVATFLTIYPGHYTGRATHIHVKVHIAGSVSGSKYSGGHVSHTGQLFFNDPTSNKVYATADYASDTAARVLNTADSVYTQQHGSKSTVKLAKRGTSITKGFDAAITLGVNPDATPAAVNAGP